MDKNPTLPTARGLTRSQAAELLGVTEREVSRMDGHLLHPNRSGDRRWLYDPAELRAILDRSGGRPFGPPTVNGDTTAAVFELFEAGRTLPQVVIATKQTASAMPQTSSICSRRSGVAAPLMRGGKTWAWLARMWIDIGDGAGRRRF